MQDLTLERLAWVLRVERVKWARWAQGGLVVRKGYLAYANIIALLLVGEKSGFGGAKASERDISAEHRES